MVNEKSEKNRTKIPELLEDAQLQPPRLNQDKRTWQQAMEDFLLWKTSHGVSQTTLKGYSNHIKHFYKYFEVTWGNELETKRGIIKHLGGEIKPATYNLRLIYLRAFFDWCIGEGLIQNNPLDGYKKRKADPRIVDIPTDILQKLLTLPDQRTFSGLRDYALILFTLDTGIRPSEAYLLTPNSFDISHLSVTISSDVSKTRKARTLPILPHTADIIKKLIRVRPDDWEDDLPVFCNSEGDILTRKKWSQRMDLYSKALDFKIRPYDLRHAFAIMYLRNGASAFALQKAMGHENMDMTKRYLNITCQDLREVHQHASLVHSLISKKKSRARKL